LIEAATGPSERPGRKRERRGPPNLRYRSSKLKKNTPNLEGERKSHTLEKREHYFRTKRYNWGEETDLELVTKGKRKRELKESPSKPT